MKGLDTSHGMRMRRMLGCPHRSSDVKRSMIICSNKPDATAKLHFIVFKWKISRGKVLQEQVSALLDQAIERAFAFATNYACLPSADVFLLLSGPTTCIGHILVKRGDRNEPKFAMFFFNDLMEF
jgi:hypothetical protein